MTAAANQLLLTIILKHDQSMPLAAIQAHLQASGFHTGFPPEGVEVVSWHVAMGLGQVVVVRLSADRLRAVNRLIEEKAWGAFQTEFYATYDFMPVWQDIRASQLKGETAVDARP